MRSHDEDLFDDATRRNEEREMLEQLGQTFSEALEKRAVLDAMASELPVKPKPTDPPWSEKSGVSLQREIARELGYDK